MRILFLYAALIIATFFYACTSKEEQAKAAFNEGVKLNLQILDYQDKGAVEKAAATNRQALAKFKSVLEINPNHEGAVVALAHAYYVNKEYKKAISYYEKAVKNYPEFAGFAEKEMGICKKNLLEAAKNSTLVDQQLERE